jgi:anti-anti-sigma factor
VSAHSSFLEIYDGPFGRPTQAPAAPGHDPDSACWCTLESWNSAGGDIVVVHVDGEVDMLTHSIIAAALTDTMDQASRHVVVDLAGVGFCWVRAFALLAETARTATNRGTGFTLSGLTRHQHRIMTLVAPECSAVQHRSVAAAVTAIRSADSPEAA